MEILITKKGLTMNWAEMLDDDIKKLVEGFPDKQNLIDFCNKHGFIYRKNQSFKMIKSDLIREITQTGIFIRIAGKQIKD